MKQREYFFVRYEREWFYFVPILKIFVQKYLIILT